MKQPGIFFIIFALLYFLFALTRLPDVSVRLAVKRGCLLLLGAIIPFVLACVVLYGVGVFENSGSGHFRMLPNMYQKYLFLWG